MILIIILLLLLLIIIIRNILITILITNNIKDTPDSFKRGTPQKLIISRNIFVGQLALLRGGGGYC